MGKWGLGWVGWGRMMLGVDGLGGDVWDWK